MIRSLKILVGISILFALACENRNQPSLSLKDTTNIINLVVQDKAIQGPEFSTRDTIYIIKTKSYNKNWPTKVGKYNLVYLEKDSTNFKINGGDSFQNDLRERISLSFMKYNADTVLISSINVGFNYEVNYTLIKQFDNWKIIDREKAFY